jgi:hypothetical protein
MGLGCVGRRSSFRPDSQGFHQRVREVLEHAHWFHAVETFPDYASLLLHLRVLQVSPAQHCVPGMHR